MSVISVWSHEHARRNVRKNWLEWHKVKNYKDTLHSHNVSSQLAKVIVMIETTLWTDEISGIDGMMTEWTPQWQWAADYSKPWCRQQRKIGHRASTFGSLARRTQTSWKIWGTVVTPTARPVVTAQRDTQVSGWACTWTPCPQAQKPGDATDLTPMILRFYGLWDRLTWAPIDPPAGSSRGRATIWSLRALNKFYNW